MKENIEISKADSNDPVAKQQPKQVPETVIETDQPEENTNEPKPSRPKKSKTKLLIIISLILLLAGGGAYALKAFYGKKPGQEPLKESENKVQEEASDIFDRTKHNSVVFTDRGNTYLYKKGDSKLQTIVDFPDEASDNVERVRITSIDPTGKYVLFTHSKSSDGSTGRFGYYKTALSLYEIGSKTTRKIIEGRENSVTHINWSPDGRKFSYILSGGKSAEIRSTDGGVLSTLSGPEIQPIVWRNNSTISFIKAGKLYQGTVDKPDQNLIAEDALGSQKVFEGPDQLQTPYWSGKYVVYKTEKAKLVIYNTDNKQAKVLGTFIAEDCYDDCPESDNISPLGWLNEAEFIYTKFTDATEYRYYDTRVSSGKTIYSTKDSVYSDAESLSLEKGLMAVIDNFDDSKYTVTIRNFGKDSQSKVCTYSGKVRVSKPSNSYSIDTFATNDLTDSSLSVVRQQAYYGRKYLEQSEPPRADVTFEVLDASNCKVLTSINL